MGNNECKKCDKGFDANENPSKRAATVTGAGAGAYVGSGVGLAMGPLEVIAGTVPGVIVGGTGGALFDKSFVTCPYCGKAQQA